MRCTPRALWTFLVVGSMFSWGASLFLPVINPGSYGSPDIFGRYLLLGSVAFPIMLLFGFFYPVGLLATSYALMPISWIVASKSFAWAFLLSSLSTFTAILYWAGPWGYVTKTGLIAWVASGTLMCLSWPAAALIAKRS